VFNKFLLMSLLLVMAGCGFEPSNKQVAAAVKESIEQDYKTLLGNEFSGLIVGMAGIEGINVDLVDKIGCQPSGKNAYLCEVAIEFTIVTKQGGFAQLFGVSGAQKSIENYRLIKTSRGWTAIAVQ
jgi:hypothetical protein